MRLSNKVSVITASTRGIGLSCVKAFAAEGAVVYMAARNPSSSEKIANELTSCGYNVKTVYNDANIPESFYSMTDEIIKNEGRLDILVNNFGVSDPSWDLDLLNTDSKFFSDTVNLNLRSVFSASQAAARYMAKGRGGSIINISSVGGIVPDISQIAYGTSKGAINYLTKLIAVHSAKYNIRCNAILPGMTETDSVNKHLSYEFRSLFLQHIPLGRLALPQEIASAAVYLASDEASYVTGQLLTVSGGFGMATPLYSELSDKSKKR